MPLLLLSDRDSLRWIRGRFLVRGRTHKFDLQTVQNNGTGENEIIYIPMFYLLNGVTHGNFCF